MESKDLLKKAIDYICNGLHIDDNPWREISEKLEQQKLSEACKLIHQFLTDKGLYISATEVEKNDNNYKKIFPITFELEKNCNKLKFQNCWKKSDNKEQCKNCEHYEDHEGKGFEYKNEINHLLTHLAYKISLNECLKKNLEPGLLVLLAEIFGNDTLAKGLKEVVEKYGLRSKEVKKKKNEIIDFIWME